jgi:uncharacterized protein
MQPSMFNVRVPLEDLGEVFLMNTFTDAQLIVSSDVADLLDRVEQPGTKGWTSDERDALTTLAENGFIVESRDADWHNVHQYFQSVRESRDQLRMTVLTTLQCNFACDYCIQGDHGDYNKTAAKMSLDTAARVAEWAERRLDHLGARSYALTFFGGEPLLNLPVVYYLAERMWNACQARGVSMLVNIITNGLLLTPEVVDRLVPFGLNGVKITLDGDRDTHNRMRPLRGGQGTFDKIINNVRQIAHKTRVAIGGNFDMETADSYPALLDFLKEQEFADQLSKVAFKPVIREPKTPQAPTAFAEATADRPLLSSKFIPLTAVGESKPLGGACMSSAGTAVSTTSGCDSCHMLDDQMSFLREETRKRGFPTVDGVHMGPCEIHRRHAHTISPDGSLYACPGFAADATQSVGHIDGRTETRRVESASRFEALAAWKECSDCAFIPVCAGGCSVAAYTELGTINKPNCHKPAMEAGLIALARRTAAERTAVAIN